MHVGPYLLLFSPVGERPAAITTEPFMMRLCAVALWWVVFACAPLRSRLCALGVAFAFAPLRCGGFPSPWRLGVFAFVSLGGCLCAFGCCLCLCAFAPLRCGGLSPPLRLCVFCCCVFGRLPVPLRFGGVPSPVASFRVCLGSLGGLSLLLCPWAQ